MTEINDPTHPRLALIVAKSENNVIGRDGDLPWRLSRDLKRFKALTMGKPLIMGRKTWESLPRKPLPGRPNIVISRRGDFSAPGAFVMSSLNAAIPFARSQALNLVAEDIVIIGGASLYEAALSLCDRLFITEVHADIEGDTCFPELNSAEWETVSRQTHEADEKNDYPTTDLILDRVR